MSVSKATKERRNKMKNIWKTFAALAVMASVATKGTAQSNAVPFDKAHWDLTNGEVTEYLGRQALTGDAVLKDIVFDNGVIEVDIAVTDVRRRSYPGLVFRVRDGGNAERFYVRPHRAPIYPDSLQYTPEFNGDSTWQFCNGEGYTNVAVIPANQWNRLKIEVHGSRARVYWNDDDKPAVVISDLKHGESKGGIELWRGAGEAPVYFSNFRYRHDDSLPFDPPPDVETPDGMIMDWEISRGYPAAKLEVPGMNYPRFFVIAGAEWEKVNPDTSGLVNVSKYRRRSSDQPDVVFARTIFQSDKKQEIRLDFGYSDEVLIFLNGRRVFYGISHYTRRDPSFLGIIGLHDAVHLTVEKGRNEIFLILKDWFGGWGFMAKADKPLQPPTKDHGRLTKVWEVTEDVFTPESVLHDPKRDVLYVTNYNPRFKKDAKEEDYVGYISKLSLDGNVLEKKWASPLHSPAGMAIHENRLYTLERRDLAEIDLETGNILSRYPIPGVDFPNDLAIDEAGNIYISDTSPLDWTNGKIYRFSKGQFEVWLEGYDAWRPNAMYMVDGKLLFGGAAGDPFVKAVDLKTKHIARVASLGAGTIDGLRIDGKGNTLVSHWEGQLYSITPSGEVTELIDAGGQYATADFEYIGDKNLLIIPTFTSNSVVAFRLRE
jgi:sugar lactone lactonase YvrE